MGCADAVIPCGLDQALRRWIDGREYHFNYDVASFSPHVDSLLPRSPFGCSPEFGLIEIDHRAWTLHFQPEIHFDSLGFPLEALQGSSPPHGYGLR